MFVLTAPLTCETERGEVISVDAGFKTDLASIPRPFMWLVPIAGRSAKPAVLHDWLLHKNDKRAVRIFNEALKATGTPTWRRWLMVAFVFLWTYPELHWFRPDDMPTEFSRTGDRSA